VQAISDQGTGKRGNTCKGTNQRAQTKKKTGQLPLVGFLSSETKLGGGPRRRGFNNIEAKQDEENPGHTVLKQQAGGTPVKSDVGQYKETEGKSDTIIVGTRRYSSHGVGGGELLSSASNTRSLGDLVSPEKPRLM